MSTDRQETQNQLSSLKEQFPLAAVFEEVASSCKARPVLATLLGTLKAGDTLIVAALDRLGRRTSEVLALIEDLERRGIVLKSIREGVDYSSIAGRLVTQILCSVAEMERRLIGERTKAALEANNKAVVRLGAPVKYGPEVLDRVYALREAGKTVRQIAAEVGMSASRVAEICRKRRTLHPAA